MQKTGFYIFWVINYLITLLPLRVLYIFSDFFYLLLYYIFKYRRKVVAENLRNSFPEMREAELKRTERRFYRHLADMFVETLKITHLSPEEITKRFRYRDMSLLQSLYERKKDVVAICSHYNNWEWLSSMPLYSPFTAMTIYMPLRNRSFDGFMLNLRQRYGVIASPMQQILRELVRLRKENVRTITAFIADQTPRPDEHTFWGTFLNQETPFYKGPEKVAAKLDMPVVFIHIIKVRRGYYEVETKLITDDPANEPPGFITSSHIRMLEEVIREKPEYWLWSHRRWKHKRKKNND
ncbi:MAG: lysophospholipid acyltransferase family protein [Bacteroidales bacterium]|nr:lysophospholipid acyltransferase family protein [Bacteroidales bacterium]